MWKDPANIQCLIEPWSGKHLISFSARLTWKEYIHEHGAFGSSRLGTWVQMWSGKSCPRNFPHCNACTPLHTRWKEEEEPKWMNHRRVNLAMSQIPPATCSFVLSSNRLGTKRAVKVHLTRSKMLFPIPMVKPACFGEYLLLQSWLHPEIP